ITNIDSNRGCRIQVYEITAEYDVRSTLFTILIFFNLRDYGFLSSCRRGYTATWLPNRIFALRDTHQCGALLPSSPLWKVTPFRI
ncbi:hypothetical protein APHAL10511_005314, partial [Amanita phalloides]